MSASLSIRRPKAILVSHRSSSVGLSPSDWGSPRPRPRRPGATITAEQAPARSGGTMEKKANGMKKTDLTTCAPGQVWDKKKHKCLERHSGVLPDPDLTEYAYSLAKADRYQEAIDVLDLLDNPNTPRALNYRGYATRKLGRTEEGIGYYLKSVALDPTYRAGARVSRRGLCHPRANSISPKTNWRRSRSSADRKTANITTDLADALEDGARPLSGAARARRVSAAREMFALRDRRLTDHATKRTINAPRRRSAPPWRACGSEAETRRRRRSCFHPRRASARPRRRS